MVNTALQLILAVAAGRMAERCKGSTVLFRCEVRHSTASAGLLIGIIVAASELMVVPTTRSPPCGNGAQTIGLTDGLMVPLGDLDDTSKLIGDDDAEGSTFTSVRHGAWTEARLE